MPIGIRTPGPIHIFGRIRGQVIATYMGTCVTAPEPEHEKFRIPVMNDLAGRSVLFQSVYDGETALVVASMNRFNYEFIQILRALDGISTLGTSLGSDGPGSRGTLTLGIKDWQLLLLYEYAGTTSSGSFNGLSDLPPGRMYYSATIKKYKESTVGTRVQEVALAIECNNIYAVTALGFGSFGLYTENGADFGIHEPIV